MDSNWIFSKKFDLSIFLFPLALAALSPLTLLLDPSDNLPLWAFLLVVVSFDVAHVWATLYRTYLDPIELRRRKMLYLLPIPIFFYISLRLHLYSPVLFWTLLAYVAIYHFITQNYGFLALYKMKKGERSTFDYHLDKWTLWMGALGPVLWWHATPDRVFNWFSAGESFIFRIDPAFIGDITAVYFGLLGLYTARQLYLWQVKRHFNPGKQIIMGGHYLTWGVGIYFTDNPLISAAFLNLFHGIPFLAMVWFYCNRKWRDPERKKRSRVLAFLSQPKNWFWFYLLIFIPALLEETLWDSFVWQVYLPDILTTPLPGLNHFAISVLVALLSLPQILHYFLDGWIWKFNKSNPGLSEFLNLAGGK